MTKVKQLVNYFKPTHYNLSIDIDEAKHTFSGLVDIEGEIKNDKIILHAKDLTITNLNVNGKKAEWTNDNDELNIIPPKDTAKDVILTISFSGQITDAMHGLYPSYFLHQGEKKKIFTTQFESHHAREVFPCVDEPSAKATFDLTLTTAPNITVLSNQPLKSQKVEGKRLVSRFKTTPLMSTYLLALVAGEMIKKTGQTKDGVEVSVYASVAQKFDDLTFALENSIQLIEFFNEYFDTPYPLAKSDQVALPDFSSGAMENWGLITYRESALLAGSNSSIDQHQGVAKVIAHELSHQWFGNLVTMQWWNDLWLNESFANMIEYLALDAIHPDWNIWEDFSSMEIPYALNRDSLDGVQSVRTEVNHPDEISSLFDGAIVYAKGGHLLYMVKNHIGDKAFRSGLQSYFQKYAFKNTVGDDLWNELALSSQKDITGLMNQWIDQPGFPVVHARKAQDKIELKQEQFFIGKHQPSTRLWPIPLDSSYTSAPDLMDSRQLSIPLSSNLFLLNQKNASHFITNYDHELRQAILQAIAKDELTDVFKIQFLNESILLAQAGLITYPDLIDTLEAFSDQTNEQVWGIVAGLLASLTKFVLDDKVAETALKNLTGKIAQHQYKRLGFDPTVNETENETKLRSTILSMVLYADEKTATERALELAKSPLESIDPELRLLILSSAVKNAKDDHLFNQLIEAYPTSHDPILKGDILSALSATKNIKQIKYLLTKITDKDFVRPQNIAYWYIRLLRNKEATDLTWSWLKDNWQWLEDTFKGDKSYDDFPRLSVYGLASKKHLKEYRKFFEPLQADPALTRTIELGLIDLEAKVNLIEKNKDIVAKKLLSI